MLNALRWILSFIWIFSLIIGLAMMRNGLDAIEIPEIKPPSTRQTEQLRQLTQVFDFQLLMEQDGSALREYLLKPDDRIQEKHNELWIASIHPLMEGLVEMRVQWESEGKVQSVQLLESVLHRSQDVQATTEEILRVARLPENQPALLAFHNELTVRFEQMQERLDKAIELERLRLAQADAPSTDSAATTGTLTASPDESAPDVDRLQPLQEAQRRLDSLMAKLELFLTTASERHREAFEAEYSRLQRNYQDLQRINVELDAQQAEAFAGFFDLFAEWQRQLPELIEMREGSEWNQALYIFNERIKPDLESISDACDALSSQLRTQLKRPDAPQESPAPKLRKQIDHARMPLVVLIFSGVIGVLATLLFLAPVERPKA
ncbi:hypothetical protein JXA32_05090 [Candidatus Sumerlaeota bacterium]|nr:hypothetical protein [Candidatus Sumerlaeota bacterium]